MEVKKTPTFDWINEFSAEKKQAPILDDDKGVLDKDNKDDDNKDDAEKDDDKNIIDSNDDNINPLPETVSQFFDKLTMDKEKDYVWYENTPIDNYDKAVEFIEMNVTDKVDAHLTNINDKWYQSKSESFRKIAEYAEMVGDDFSKVIDLINIEKRVLDFDTLDTKNEDDAEVIISEYLKFRGESPELILKEIEDLKERGKLIEKADIYKPQLIEKQVETSKLLVEKEKENLKNFYSKVQEINDEVIEFVTKPEVAGLKLDNVAKNNIYNALVYDDKINGFGINKVVEDLHRAKNYDLLAKITLLATNEEYFNKLYTSNIKAVILKDLSKKIRRASEVTSSTDEFTPEQKNPLPAKNPQKLEWSQLVNNF